MRFHALVMENLHNRPLPFPGTDMLYYTKQTKDSGQYTGD